MRRVAALLPGGQVRLWCSWRVGRAVGIAWVWCAVLVGCEERALREQATDLQRELSQDPARPGKVGTLRALEITQQAQRVARALVTRPDPRCAWSTAQRRGGYTLTTDISARITGRTPPLEWTEQITTRVRSLEQWSISRHVSFRQETGQRGVRRVRHVAERGADGARLLISTTPGVFYARDATPAARARVLREATGAFGEVMALVPGWREGGPDAWSMGEGALRCAVSSVRAEAWRVRLGLRASPIKATVRVTARDAAGAPLRREVYVKQALEPFGALSVVVEESLDPATPDLGVVPAEQIVDIRRDRSAAQRAESLRLWSARGWVTPAPEPASDAADMGGRKDARTSGAAAAP